MLLKDGRRIADANVWRDINKELILPAMNEENAYVIIFQIIIFAERILSSRLI